MGCEVYSFIMIRIDLGARLFPSRKPHFLVRYSSFLTKATQNTYVKEMADSTQQQFDTLYASSLPKSFINYQFFFE